MGRRFPDAEQYRSVVLPDEGDWLLPLIGEPKLEAVEHRMVRLKRAHAAQPWLGKHCRSCTKSQFCKIQDTIFFGNYQELPGACEARVRERD